MLLVYVGGLFPPASEGIVLPIVYKKSVPKSVAPPIKLYLVDSSSEIVVSEVKLATVFPKLFPSVLNLETLTWSYLPVDEVICVPKKYIYPLIIGVKVEFANSVGVGVNELVLLNMEAERLIESGRPCK